VADAATSAEWDEVVFFDDRYSGSASPVGPWNLVGSGAALLDSVDLFAGVLVAIGNNEARLAWYRRLHERQATFATIVHPRGWVSSHASLGAGSVVMAGGVVNIGAKGGAATIINTGATVDHDCELGEAVHISPGAHLSGTVRIGHRSWIGAGAIVRQNITIGCGVIIGAGAVVISDIPDDVTAIGVPAKPRL
jgi:sugar O-acyltransferase (sialic acid O-acetyltransferase NeuD family)